jgi:hypothetical protein
MTLSRATERVDLTDNVRPPEGWEWEGPAPPERVELEEDLVGAWTLQTS